MYALAGMALVVSIPKRRAQIARQIGLWFGASVVLVGLTTLLPSPLLESLSGPNTLESLQQSVTTLAQGSFVTGAVARAQIYLQAQRYQIIEFLPQLLFFMTLGAYAARVGVLRRPERYRRFWRACLAWGIGLGVPINVAFVWTQFQLAQSSEPEIGIAVLGDCLYTFAAVLTPAYVAAIVLASLKAKPWRAWDRVLALLAQTGRLALSNYILQSVGYLLLFSSAGLGLAPSLSLAELAVIGLGLCVAQCLASAWYLQHFKSGPLEWLWRRYVYVGAAASERTSY